MVKRIIRIPKDCEAVIYAIVADGRKIYISNAGNEMVKSMPQYRRVAIEIIIKRIK